MTLKVKIIKDVNKVNGDFESHVFASEGYLKACSDEYGWFCGHGVVLPFYIDKILIFRRLIFTTAPYGYETNDITHDILSAFMDEVVQVCKGENICDFISKPQSNAVFPVAPTGGVVCDWGSYITKIDLEDEDLIKSYHSKHRNVIVKSMRDGVEVRVIEDEALVQDCVKQTLLRQKLPYYPSLQFVSALRSALPENTLMMAAYHQEQLQGVALVPYDSDCGYYLYGGSIPQPYGGSLNLLQYEVMRQLRDRGVKYYDFVGARLKVEQGGKYEGIQRFKVRFGAQLVKGYAFRVVFSPFKYWLFNFMVRVYFRLKGWEYKDAIDQIRMQSSE
ncbi:lipid II:glycine glycyltransferase FemX [Chromobacterium violaceum]|uniref:Uncharacterized protein n=2 Tax=Chromobacterium violaceum TaxID=536 RepID=Q7NQW3_CHRVO|nr:peptidoglycan bridge formation glycyltransferase FemA/FemB family protein [Chromobacterium violaceum]AAQ61684.1 hypothetical protein CV_4023 [Chromobacterium violaceum ATCC 12472]MBA8736600.1 peptidoglycan bridge formation glycyltransferase FemA/FemB family protein [Chromobacterium violaceum]OVE46530.1 hypothetical protein CBW21_17955 [Chromobacterium violaceum]SUX89127.1 Uncharacterized protein involved in methicillin resistance [Chromobacterium violaceum]